MIFQYPKNISSLMRCIIVIGLMICGFTDTALSETARIAVVKSTGTEQNTYERISRSIVSTLKNSDMNVEIIDEVTVKTDPLDKNGFWDTLAAKQPDLIVTIGQQATFAASRNVRDIPVIFGEVLSTDFLVQSPHLDFNGVVSSIPIEDYFTVLHEAFPSAKKIGLLSSERNAEFYRFAHNIAGKMGLELVTYKSEYAHSLPGRSSSDFDSADSIILQDFPKALKEILPKVDVILIPFEFNEQIQVPLKPEFIRSILAECLKYNVPIMTSEILAKQGALLSVWRDEEDMGRQTAELVLKRNNLGPFPEKIIETPQTIKCYINQSMAERLGITFPKSIQEKAVMFGTEKDEDSSMFPYPRF